MALPSCHSGYRCRHRRPNKVLAQRREEDKNSEAGETAGSSNPQAGLVPGGANRTNMFHAKHFGTIGAKNLTRPQTAAPSMPRYCPVLPCPWRMIGVEDEKHARAAWIASVFDLCYS